MSKMLCDVAEIIDSLHKTPKYKEKGFPMVRVVDVNNGFLELEKCFTVDENTCDEHNKNHIPQVGDVIITRVGSYGMLAYVNTNDKFCLGQNIAIISPKMNEKFLYYYLKSPFIQNIIYGNSGGSSYKCISLEEIKRLPYCDSKLHTEKIGDLLYSIDSKIENNNRINAELELMAKTIYDYCFLQFDFPDEYGNPYKSSGGKMVWTDELKMEIPEGWKVKSLSDVGDLLMGQSPKSESYNDNGDGYPLINGAAELQDGKIYISKYTNMPTRICKKDDLIFCIRATIGNLQFAELEYCLGRGVAAFTPKCKEYSEYLYNVINNILDVYKKTLSGSIIVGITKDDLSDKLILWPPDEIIERFSNIVKSMMIKIRSNKKENKELESLRDYLLPLLMNGQVGFKE